jgi:argininosuccinate lyase
LAEILVREGVPFREAHEAVGRVVGHCVEKDLDLRSLSSEDLKAFHAAFPGSAAELLDLERSIEARSLAGGTARATVETALARAEEALGAESALLDALDARDEETER